MAYYPLRPDQVHDRELWTYQDTVAHLMDFIGAQSDPTATRQCKMAAREALRELVDFHQWTYYIRVGILETVASRDFTDLWYNHTGDADGERVAISVTAGEQFSSADVGAYLRVNNVSYRITEYVAASTDGDSMVILAEESNPGEDFGSVSTPVTGTVYKDSYPMPSDFRAIYKEMVDSANLWGLALVGPSDALGMTTTYQGPSEPSAVAFIQDSWYYGRTAAMFSPPPLTARTYTFPYRCSARPLKNYEVNAGTVSVTSGSKTVTGSGTAFTSDHVGTVIRVSDSTSTAPTWKFGSNTDWQERVIQSVTSTTVATVDSTFDTTVAATKYVITDPVDIDNHSMLNAYLRCCEAKLAHLRSMENKQSVKAEYLMAVKQAMSSENKDSSRHGMSDQVRLGITEALLARGPI